MERVKPRPLAVLVITASVDADACHHHDRPPRGVRRGGRCVGGLPRGRRHHGLRGRGTRGAIASAVGSFLLYDLLLHRAARGRSPSMTRASSSTPCCCSSWASSSDSWPHCSAHGPPRPWRASGRRGRSSASAASWPRATRRRPCSARSPPSCAPRREPSGSGSSLGPDDASERMVGGHGRRAAPRARAACVERPGRARATRCRSAGSASTGHVLGLASDAGVGGLPRPTWQPAERTFGSIWCLRERRLGDPDRTETRLLRRRRRPGRPGPGARPTGGRIAGRRGGAPERRPEVGPAPVGVARPAHAAGDHPGRRGVARPGRGLSPDEQRESRRRHRPRGGVPEPPRHQPARPQPHRGRGTDRRARRLRARRPRGSLARPTATEHR